MKLSSIALDYDGTIARGDRIEPDVREAIAFARSRGVIVVLVTGRILDDLRRVAGELHFVDGVVAENGAVLHFPESDHTSLLTPAAPQAFVDELTRRGVDFHAGKSLVDAHASAAPIILDVIHALELPLVLMFNKGRVMAMPQGVSKGTGLRKALDTLRLSARNTVAIGDAENDHELLRLAEVGVAVPWGSAALRAAADVVLPGDSTATVANFLRGLADSGTLPAGAEGRRKLLLGYTEDGQEFSLAAQGRNVLVAGDTRSGKSWIAGLLCEQLILHGYCVCVIDPEGDYRSLEALPGVTLLGGEDPPPSPRDVMRALRYPDRSVVIDLSRSPQDEKLACIRNTLSALSQLRRRTGLPHRIVIDEAHYFLHGGLEGLLDLESDGYTVVTYCASKLPKALLDSTEVILVTCESNPAEINALCALCGDSARDSRDEWSGLSRLKPGQAIALPITTESGGRLRRFNVARRLTPHVRHREKYVDVPVSDQRAFVFATGGRVRTLRQFVAELERRPAPALEPFVGRGDFSRWIKDVFGDHSLAAEMRAIESRHRGASTPHTIADLIDAIRSRYDLREEAVAS